MSYQVYPGQSSTFTSPLLYSSISCITFDYKIHGNKTGCINVNLIGQNGKKMLLWRQSGYHGNVWNKGQIPIRQEYPFKVNYTRLSYIVTVH